MVSAPLVAEVGGVERGGGGEGEGMMEAYIHLAAQISIICNVHVQNVLL